MVKKSKQYTEADIQKISDNLSIEPEHDKFVTKFEAIKLMSAKLQAMISAKISIKEIANRLTKGGFPISGAVLGIYLKNLKLYSPTPRTKRTPEERQQLKDEKAKKKLDQKVSIDQGQPPGQRQHSNESNKAAVQTEQPEQSKAARSTARTGTLDERLKDSF